MNQIGTYQNSTQLDQLITRIERIEARLATSNGTPPSGSHARTTHYCSLPQVPPRSFDPTVSADRMRLIQLITKKWVNGTKLRYYFFQSGSFSAGNEQKDIVRRGFQVWKDLGIGIDFKEVNSIGEAEIRIGFLQGDGAWSYVGRDTIDIPGPTERTMNFGWDLREDPRGVDVPVHEIGHALGFPHEHQNPFAGIVWNEDAVYAYFAGSPNYWDRETTYYNILRKLSPGEVQGSQWDANSVMHYSIEPGLIEKPEQYRNGVYPAGGLSNHDIQQVRLFYPPIQGTTYPELKPFLSQLLSMAPSEQMNFAITPPSTGDYTIQTFGKSDTVIVLFEDMSGDMKFVDGDDDSGTDTNALIKVRLYEGRRYVLRVRLLYKSGSETSIMLTS